MLIRRVRGHSNNSFTAFVDCGACYEKHRFCLLDPLVRQCSPHASLTTTPTRIRRPHSMRDLDLAHFRSPWHIYISPISQQDMPSFTGCWRTTGDPWSCLSTSFHAGGVKGGIGATADASGGASIAGRPLNDRHFYFGSVGENLDKWDELLFAVASLP